MTYRDSRAFRALIIATAAAGAAAAGAQTVERPDFTGVWTWNMRAGDNPLQPLTEAAANLPFTAEMRPRIEEYRAMARLALMDDRRFVTLDPNVRLNVEPDLDIWRERLAVLAPRADVVKVSAEDIDLDSAGSRSAGEGGWGI